jgi:transposase
VVHYVAVAGRGELTALSRFRGGRPPASSREDCQQRNVVERAFSRLTQWRDLATRYTRRAAIYRASLVVISALIWLTCSAGHALGRGG